jgi:hypothetical protein
VEGHPDGVSFHKPFKIAIAMQELNKTNQNPKSK